MSKTKAWLSIFGGMGFIALGLYLGLSKDDGLILTAVLFFVGTTIGAISKLVAHKLHEQPVSYDSDKGVILRRNRIYPLLSFVSLSVLGTAIVYGFIAIDPNHVLSRGLTGGELKFILLLILPFVVYGAWFYLSELCRADSDIVLNRYGINDQRTPYKSVTWAEITNVELDGDAPQQRIILTLRHPTQHPRPWWRRLLDLFRNRITPVPLCIYTGGMIGSPQSLFEEIRTRARPKLDERV
ncbi:hypothetical protein [Dongia sp.]|uniref:hypothetical protein n=1 Tax=Dongia sp. TaxID=1977262 RepID=UPI0035B08AA1